MKAILFVPGYKGSFLASTTNQTRCWLRLSQIVPWDQTKLSLSFSASGIPDKSEVKPQGIFDRLKLFPGVSKDIYFIFLKRLKLLLPYHQIIPFGYDWRIDLFDSIQRLNQQVHQLKKHGYNDIDIIAHSMGGMIVAYWLKYGISVASSSNPTWDGARLVKHIIFAGVPFCGTSMALWYALQGNPVGLNRQLLSPTTVATFASAYQMIPKTSHPTLYAEQTHNAIDLFDIKEWSKQELAHPIMHIPGALSFIEQQLKLGLTIKTGIQQKSSVPKDIDLKILNLSSSGYKTLDQISWSKEKHTLIWPTSSGKIASTITRQSLTDGDGIVTNESSILPESFQTFGETRKVKIRHETFFHLKNIEKIISDHLLN